MAMTHHAAILKPDTYSHVNTPTYMNKYPHVFKASQIVKNLIHEMRHQPTVVGKFILSARFGKLRFNGDGTSTFIAGISTDFLEECFKRLSTCTNWTKVSTCETRHVFYYTLDGQSDTIRSTVYFNDPFQDKDNDRLPATIQNPNQQNESEPCALHVEHVRKRDYKQLDFQCIINSHHVQTVPTPRHYDLRVSLSYENIVPEDDLPGVVNPTFVQIQNVKTFTYTSKGYNEPTWAFLVIRTWDGSNRTEAEEKQQTNQEPICDFKCVCLDPRVYMDGEAHDDLYTACSLLLKMTDFLPNSEGNNAFFLQSTQPAP